MPVIVTRNRRVWYRCSEEERLDAERSKEGVPEEKQETDKKQWPFSFVTGRIFGLHFCIPLGSF
jgi:hypothetical protein